MNKVRLGLDIDGVLYRWSDTARYLLLEHWGVDPGEPQYWDWIKDHVEPDAWDWLWSEAITKHGLYRYGSLYKGSREFLDRMEPYCDNVIITSRPALAVRDTMDWLSYQKIPTAEIHIIGGETKKSTILPQCDVYIDDALHNAQDFLDNTKGVVIVPDRSSNQGDIYEKILRTYSWEQVEQVLVETYKKLNVR